MNPLQRAVRTVLPALLLMLSARAFATAPELVLQEGVRLVATTASGTVGVTAGEGLARAYDWGDCRLDAAMMARSRRWFGAKGIYDPAGRGPLGMLFGKLIGCDGISRTVVDEAQIHFSTVAAAERWTRFQKDQPFETVWTRDGLVVRWGLSPGRQQISVDVYQLCVAGAWPTDLRGATDDVIQVLRTVGDGPARHPCAVVGPDEIYGKGEPWHRP